MDSMKTKILYLFPLLLIVSTSALSQQMNLCQIIKLDAISMSTDFQNLKDSLVKAQMNFEQYSSRADKIYQEDDSVPSVLIGAQIWKIKGLGWQMTYPLYIVDVKSNEDSVDHYFDRFLKRLNECEQRKIIFSNADRLEKRVATMEFSTGRMFLRYFFNPSTHQKGIILQFIPKPKPKPKGMVF